MNLFKYLLVRPSLCRYMTDNYLKKILSKTYGKVLEIGASPNSPYKKWSKSKEYLLTNYDLDYKKNKDFQFDLKIDIKSIDLPNDEIDFVICVSVLEHIDDPLISMHEMLRVLKPGGSIIVAVPWQYPYHKAPKDYIRFSVDWFSQFSSKAKINHIPVGNKFSSFASFYQLWFLKNWKNSRYQPFTFIKFITCSFIGIFFYFMYFFTKNKKIFEEDCMMHIFLLKKI